MGSDCGHVNVVKSILFATIILANINDKIVTLNKFIFVLRNIYFMRTPRCTPSKNKHFHDFPGCEWENTQIIPDTCIHAKQKTAMSCYLQLGANCPSHRE